VARLRFAAICSLDGYVNDERGNFDWSAPDEEVHAFANDLERGIGTHLLGRRMYEVLAVWDTMPTGPDQPAAIREFAEVWRTTDKVVYSGTLEDVRSARTRIERTFEPEAVRRMKAEAREDLSVGGPTLAAEAFRSGLVDDVHLFLNPVVIGSGTRALPGGVRLDLDLVDEHRFANGVVHLHHAVRR
jgi:dihydrofolate reductase